jgi:hypothetical protein
MADDNVVYPSSHHHANDALTEVRPSRSAVAGAWVAYHPSAARYSTVPTAIFAPTSWIRTCAQFRQSNSSRNRQRCGSAASHFFRRRNNRAAGEILAVAV